MDLRVFEKTPSVAPLLVRLYESHKLYSLAQDKAPLAKAELTSAVAALLEINLTPNEQELLTDVLIALTRQAERDLRRALAEKLSASGTVPLRLVLHLVNDDIQIAAPVLRKSPVLSDLDLIYIIKSQGADYWREIAARESLSPQVVDILADTKDPGTALVLTQNERISLSEHALNILARVACESEEVARPLLRRPEVPYELAKNIYQHVGEELKDYIRSFYGVDKSADRAMKIVEDLVVDFVDPRREFMPTAEMIKVAKKYSDLGMLNLQSMVETLQKGMVPNFIAMFAQYTGLPTRRIHDFLQQPCPRGMAIACRAFGVQKSDFSRIYLMTHRMRSNERIVNHKDMLEVLAYFDKVRPEVAARIVRGTAA